MIERVPEDARPAPRPRSESRETVALRAIRDRQPELAEAVDMHLELLELQRRIQGRVPLPTLDLSAETFARHQASGRPLLPFDAIPLELTDLRLMVRQTADVLRRFGALDDVDYQKVQAIGRDMKLLAVVGDWYRKAAEREAVAPAGLGHVAAAAPPTGNDALSEVLALAMRPFLSRCAEVLQQRSDLATWNHPHCALCGGTPDFAVITPAAERHLICGRCALRWKFEPLTCPFCLNADRSRITSFAARLGDADYRVYACDVCHRFLKALDGRRAARPVMPVVDAVATLPLDAAAIQRGYTS
ncbi:MAG TPA: formate dehydrogenase accessory protein FdhE [Tepidisphaeraceae bacterium]|nr:formate dehydrogenase accessory protein FdhE [Tepidisphaeraceae bacterium]